MGVLEHCIQEQWNAMAESMDREQHKCIESYHRKDRGQWSSLKHPLQSLTSVQALDPHPEYQK